MDASPVYKFLCWQDEHVPVVINKEAVSVDAPIFLATHSPFNKITYLRTPARLDSTSEDKFLDELVRRSRSDRHIFAVIQGIPGSGKSHLIRWLKERYVAECAQKGSQDVVLLIERANNTLRQTLQQILDSNVFDSALFALQRHKLAHSTNQLSADGLEETLINNLQIAYLEDKVKGQPALRPNLERHLNDFLLDSTVRSELRRDDGPIKRIVRHLAAANRRDTEEIAPEFYPDDFNFKADFLHSLRGEVRRDTIELVSKLSKEQARIDLAAYLNQRLEFAIGRTTSLSSDDLKQMFNDLRQELRRQGRSLALFIEDITAFTGLDTGLLDVLITQHTGEGNSAFCRLLSVVGVTDDYYNQRFPENVKDRISHHLTLNAKGTAQGNVVAELLTSPEATAELAARYLNAIRLAPEKLQEWYAAGAQEAQLPIACEGCPVRAACHSAFGTVKLEQADGGVKTVGLYPFNAAALWTMYQNIDTSKSLRTPRTLLNGIISHILLSYSRLIATGRFPPPRTQVGSEFEAPSLLLPQQRSLFSANNLSQAESDRIESLVVFWGDRTLNSTQNNGDRYLGAIPSQLFQAFGLPLIEGQAPNTKVSQTKSVGTTEGSKDGNHAAQTNKAVERKGESGDSVATQTVTPAKEDPITRDIEGWWAGGRLQNYSALGQALARFAVSAIDWAAYDLPESLVNDRVRQVYFSFENQDGKRIRNYFLPFARTESLRNAFHAAHALRGNYSQLPPDQLSVHLTALTVWLEENEERIVNFVRAPQENGEDAPSLLTIQLQNVAALATLAGELDSNSAQPADQLARRLIAFSAKKSDWKNSIAVAESRRLKPWVGLMRNKQITDHVDSIRDGLLESLNCPQGRGSVPFIDMATLLDTIQKFRATKWLLVDLDLNGEGFKGEGDVWQKPLSAYGPLAQYLGPVLEGERAELQSLLARLESRAGDATGSELDSAIKRFLAALANAGYPPPDDLAASKKPTFSTMETTLTIVRNLINETNLANFAPGISGTTATIERLRGYVRYLEALQDHALAQSKNWQEALAKDADIKNQLDQLRTTVTQLYTQTATALADLIVPEKVL